MRSVAAIFLTSTDDARSFDIELPTECDDEYWEDKLPLQVASQPPGLPSRVAFFNSYLRLNNIFAFVLQLLVCLSFAQTPPFAHSICSTKSGIPSQSGIICGRNRLSRNSILR